MDIKKKKDEFLELVKGGSEAEIKEAINLLKLYPVITL